MKLRNGILLMITASMILAFSCACENESGNSGKGSFSVESAFIQESGNHLMINAEYPVVKGVAGVEDLNTEIKESVENAAEEVRSAALELEGREGFTASLNSDYQYFNNKNIASIWINFDNYTGGAHGLYWIDSYTLNTDTGQIYTFPMLFVEDKGGVEYVTEKILKEISKHNEKYFQSAADTVKSYKGDYNFLINGDELVVYFPLYEIAPYVAGIQSFDFSSENLAGLLKPEIIEAMNGQEEQTILFLDN